MNIVCGLGRCGTSLAMQMLDASGLPCIGIYPAYEDGLPYEVRLHEAPPYRMGPFEHGKLFKLIDPHLFDLSGISGKAVFLTRNPLQQAKSQLKFVGAILGESDENPKSLRRLRDKNRQDNVVTIPAALSDFDVLKISFEELISNTAGAAARMYQHFSGNRANNEVLEKMIAVRVERSPNCYDGLLELSLIK